MECTMMKDTTNCEEQLWPRCYEVSEVLKGNKASR